MVKGSEIGGFGGSSLENPRGGDWATSVQWLGLALGVTSRPKPPSAR